MATIGCLQERASEMPAARRRLAAHGGLSPSSGDNSSGYPEPRGHQRAMNASDLVMFALGLALIVGGLALIVGGGVALGAALGWNIARRVTRYLLGGRSFTHPTEV